LLPKLCRLQRINIRCRNWVVWNELTFVAKSCVLQQNCDSLPKLSWLQWTSFRLRIGSLQRTSFRWRIGRLQTTNFAVEMAFCSEPVFAANFYNRPPRLKWLKC
jgi:hypothetical protein